VVIPPYIFHRSHVESCNQQNGSQFPKKLYSQSTERKGSLTATTVASGWSRAARMTRRPMRPNPLIPIWMGMVSLVDKVEGGWWRDVRLKSDRRQDRKKKIGRGCQ